MQRAVASGAYPVRLSPRHLRHLAQNQDWLEQSRGVASADKIRHIHTATRPTISLDASLEGDSSFSLIETMSAPKRDLAESTDREEAIGRLLEVLRPREQQVLELRFGLGDKTPLSLSQIGAVLAVSKEGVRQIQDRALEKLRAIAQEQQLGDLILAND